MFANIICRLLPLAMLTSQVGSDKKADAARIADGRTITLKEAAQELNKMIEDDGFLSSAEYLERWKKRIRAENNKESILNAGTTSSGPGGNFIGPWGFGANSNTFSYIAKSQKRDELFVIRGHFLVDQDKWRAKICEASVTKLGNVFGPSEVEKIKVGMSLTDVTTTLGVPPGAYFTGEMGLCYPSGRRLNWPFTGTSSDFKESHRQFFLPHPDAKNKEWFQRAWVSNDIVVSVMFTDDWTVTRIHVSDVMCPYECPQSFGKIFYNRKPEAKEKK